ncbi:hypothetical protein BH11PLA2_BH11PLA2_13580 [soil metagenome]
MTPALLLSLLLAADPKPAEGIRPVNTAGTPLNLDFETGTLADWTPEGDAFDGQPIKGDSVHARRKDMKSGHTGNFWIGTYEKHGDKAKGTLTSTAFKVTHPWATFLIGGGSGPDTRVEILLDGKVIFKAHGADSEEMKRTAVDLAKYRDKLIQIRIVDNGTKGWGHINFDDFRFHTAAPKVPKQQASPMKFDEQKNAGLSPLEAAKAMTVPEGFSVSLFAGEPDVHQPIAFCFDDRGRLWVVEAFTYPQRHAFPGPLLPDADKAKGDRILIFEDTDGDGKFDKKTVFIEGLNLVSGIEFGFGGIYVGAAPYLLHIPIKDDKPAGPPVILLDGWGYQDTHETLNSFVWGPDGWLYGCHGVFTHSKVGKPGAPDKDRTPINAGVWRYHPTRHVFERFAEGTSNPWGLDYNQYGDFFVEACVIPHLFHIVQGGRYTRQAGQHFNPHTYIEIPTCADHLHYLGANPHGGNNKSNDAGGGHAHCGLMCYQGGAWPKEYHGQLFMGNIHGKRINVDIPEPKGSSYVARHGKDFLLANDAWARFIALKYGPDGNVFVIDWYDKQACHLKQPEVWDRTNGRIYKINYRGTKPVVGLDLQKCTDAELVKYQTHENEWYAQHARRILQERYSKGWDAATRFASRDGEASKKPELKQLRDQLIAMASSDASAQSRLRANWTLFACEQFEAGWNAYSEANPTKLKSDEKSNEADQYVRSWKWQFHFEDPTNPSWNLTGEAISPLLRDFFKNEDSKVVQRQLMSILLRMKPQEAERIITAISDSKFDYDDPIVRLQYWYGLEHIASWAPGLAYSHAIKTNRADLIQMTARRIVIEPEFQKKDTFVFELIDQLQPELQAASIRGLTESLSRNPQITVSQTFRDHLKNHLTSSSPVVRSASVSLAVTLRDPAAMDTLRSLLTDPKAEQSSRQSALTSLMEVKDAKLAAVLPSLLTDVAMRGSAVRALASLGTPETPAAILKQYASFSTLEKRDAIATLSAKPAFAMALLDAIASMTIPAADVPAETIRQLRTFKDAALNAKVEAVWGTFRDSPADRKKLIADWKKKLALSHIPDLSAGRAVFAKTCLQCHTLYGVGGSVGPDITGSNRADLNYLLENIFDPSAVIPKEYAATQFNLADGRTLIGIVKVDGPQITLQTATEQVRFAATDVETRKPSALSMMPDDITKQASETDIKNLIAYLRFTQQVPMKATKENQAGFFNGKDLTGWDGDKEVWSVENGEIVGKTEKGLKRNTFLKSTLEAGDFKISLKVKLTPNKANSGLQFRSVPIEGGEMKGPQADIGAGWWGKLYEESGRGLLVKEGGEKHIKPDEWNDYAVEAIGPTVKIWINGQLVADYTDDKLAKRGIFGLQVHSGGPTEVRFKEIKFEVIEK